MKTQRAPCGLATRFPRSRRLTEIILFGPAFQHLAREADEERVSRNLLRELRHLAAQCHGAVGPIRAGGDQEPCNITRA